MRTYLISRYQQALTAAKLSTAKAAPLADCVLKKLESEGVKTYAQAKSAQAQVTADQRACAKQIGLR